MSLPAEGSVGRAVNHLCFLLISRADRDQAGEAEPRWEEVAVMYDQFTLQLMLFLFICLFIFIFLISLCRAGSSLLSPLS